MEIMNNYLDKIVEDITSNVIKTLFENNSELDRQYYFSHEIDKKDLRKQQKKENEETKEEDDDNFDQSLKSDKKDSSDNEQNDNKEKHAGTKDSPKLNTPSVKNISSPTLQDIIDKLNILRGGKSTRNSDVKNSLKSYYNGLNSTEKSTLLVFLTALSQILAGVENGDTALDLHDVGIDIENKGDIDKKALNPENNINKEKQVQNIQNKKVEKDLTQTITKSTNKQQPIIVGESQNKDKIIKLVKENFIK